MPIQIVQSEWVYRGRVFALRKDRVRLPNGEETELDIVDHGGAVVIVPVDDDGNLWIIRQYRHAAGMDLVEFPAGTLEDNEDIGMAANRELREEIGMAAGKLQKIGQFYLAPGYSTEKLHIFLAYNLTASPLPRDLDELLQVEKKPIAEVYSMAGRGDIQDAKSLAALLLAQRYLSG